MMLDTTELLSAIASMSENVGGDRLARAAGNGLIAKTRKVIEAEGPGWPAKKGGGPLLRKTGKMVASLGIDSATDIEVVVGLDHPAGYHVTGTKRMPRRDPFEFVEKNDLGDVVVAITEEMVK